MELKLLLGRPTLGCRGVNQIESNVDRVCAKKKIFSCHDLMCRYVTWILLPDLTRRQPVVGTLRAGEICLLRLWQKRLFN